MIVLVANLSHHYYYYYCLWAHSSRVRAEYNRNFKSDLKRERSEETEIRPKLQEYFLMFTDYCSLSFHVFVFRMYIIMY